MKILSKKILRDIKFQKGRSFSIIIIIALAMGLYSGILMAYQNAESSFTDAENNVNLHSARYISALPVTSSDLDLDQFSSVKAWDSRLSLISSFYIDGDSDNSFTAPMYGIAIDSRPKVDDFEILDGRYIQADNEILVEEGFLEANGVEIGDTVTLVFEGQEIDLKIVGAGFSAEYIYNVNPKTGLPDLTSVAPIWGSIEYFQELSGFNGINEIVVRFSDNIHRNAEVVDTYIDEILDYLHDDINPTFAVIELTDEPDQQMKEGDLGALDDFARVFGGVVLLIALFAIYDNISKLIAGQRNYIGTMRALGGSKNKVTMHYATLAMTLASMGVVVGTFLGYVINYGMVIEYTHIIGIPEPEIQFYWDSVFESLIIHLGLSLLISISTSIRAASIEPREAMSSAYITQIFRAKPIMERFLGSIGKLEPTSAIAIRNIFRNKRKTILTIFTFAMSIVLMLSALAFTDSFNAAIAVNYEERQQFDMEIYLAHSMPSTDVLDAINEISEINTAESFINQLITLEMANSHETKATPVYGYDQNSHLRSFELIEGDRSGAVISSLLADELDYEVGDEIEIINSTVEITGIANEMIAEAVFLNIQTAQNVCELQNNVTGLIISVTEGTDINDIKQEINEVLPVAVIIATEDIKDSIEYLIQGLFAIIGVMVLIGFLTVALFSFNTIVLEIISRENEFVNLKSLGSNNRKILKIILLQSLVVSIGGALLSIPLSYFIADQAIKAMMEGLMNIDTVISVEAYIISIGSAFLASMTGIVAAYRHVKRIDLVNAMRNRVSN